MKPYWHPGGYVYYQDYYNDGETVDRRQVREHHLVFLLHEQCDDPSCDCGCPPECDGDHDLACPYKVFSDGAWHVHHGDIGDHYDGDIPRVPDKWANFPWNLTIMPDVDHSRHTYESMGGIPAADD